MNYNGKIYRYKDVLDIATEDGVIKFCRRTFNGSLKEDFFEIKLDILADLVDQLIVIQNLENDTRNCKNI